jgi:predicted NACHT family NTPase
LLLLLEFFERDLGAGDSFPSSEIAARDLVFLARETTRVDTDDVALLPSPRNHYQEARFL